MGFTDIFKRRALRKAVAQLKTRTVGQLMTSYVVSMHPDETVIRAATKMIAEDISCMVVLEGGELKGIFSERDFLTKVPLNKKVFNMKVKDIMTKGVVTVEPSLSLPEAVALMKKHNFRRLVVAEHGKVLGIVTQTDFSLALLNAFSSTPLSDELTIRKIMSSKVLTATPKETFSKARDKMKKINVGSILIMDKDVPLGIFTEYDVVMQFYDQEGQLSLKDLASYMKKYVRAASPGMNMLDANKLLVTKRMRRLPVVENEKVIGIVTQTDIIRFLFCNLDKLVELSEKAEFKKLLKRYEGDFMGEHLKVYPV